MRGTTRTLAVLGLLAAVAVLSACGSDEFEGRVSRSDADALRASLAQVRDDVDNGECESASSGAQAFVDGVNDLPLTATVELKEALRDAGEQLERLVSEECPSGATTGTTETTTTETTSTTDTTTTDTTTTDTTTTDTTTGTGTTTTGTQPAGSGNGGATGGGGGADGGTGGSGGTSG